MQRSTGIATGDNDAAGFHETRAQNILQSRVIRLVVAAYAGKPEELSTSENDMKIVQLLFCLLLVLPARAADPTTSYNAVLQQYVHDGRVDYKALKNDPRLVQYIRFTEQTNPDKLPSDKARLAFWINAYNAWTLKIICDHYPVGSITELAVQKNGKSVSVWDQPLVTIGGKTMTLNNIEHNIIRVQFREPRIHFALVCAAKSCPPLRPEAYTEQQLDKQLNEQARMFVRDQSKNSFDAQAKVASISPLFDWYAEDFGGKGEPVLRYLALYASPETATVLKNSAKNWQLRFMEYDWRLNE